MKAMNTGQAIGSAMEAVRMSLGMSQRDVEEATGIPRDTFRKWARGDREPTGRMVGIWLASMETAVRRRAPELDHMLDPLRAALGRDVGAGGELLTVVTVDSVPAPDAVKGQYGVRMPDGRVAICDDREMVPGHLHAARWRSATGATAGIYRVTPVARTQVALTQDNRPGDVLIVKSEQLDRCDPVIAIVQHLLPETRR